MTIELNIDKHMMKVFFALSLLVTVGVLNKYAPVWPVLPFLKYGGTVLGVVVATYLISFLGSLSYLITKNKAIDTALSKAESLDRFFHAMNEPTTWGNITLLATAGYFASTHWGYMPLIGAMEIASIALLATSIFAVFRNLHLIRMFLTATMYSTVEINHFRDVVMAQIMERMHEAAEEEEENTKAKEKTEDHHIVN